MQIYFHSRLCSYLSRVPILVEGTVYIFTFTFMHLADAFIQSDFQCIQAIHFFFFFISMCVPWELNP